MPVEPITQLLQQLASGERGDDERFAAAVVQALERIADRELSQRNPGGVHGLTLEPRVFAHDALLKVLEQRRNFANRGHFFAYATQIMVRAMIDYHRARLAEKRGGALQRISLADDATAGDGGEAIDIGEVPAALEDLQALDPRKADVVRLRVFWGATSDEIADALDVSVASVERDWRFAKRWLAVRMREAGPG